MNNHVSKKRLSRPSDFETLRPTKRQKISNNSIFNGGALSSRWNASILSNTSTLATASQITEERKKRLKQFLSIKNLASSTKNDNHLINERKKTVFEATKNKKRNDIEIKQDLEKFMKKVDNSKLKIQKDLDKRLKKRLLNTQNNDKNNNNNNNDDDIDPIDAFMASLTTKSAKKSTKKKAFKSSPIYNDESVYDEDDILIDDDDINSNVNVISGIGGNGNKKEIKLIDHSLYSDTYPKIRKKLYVESRDISDIPWDVVHDIRKNDLNCNVIVSNKDKYDLKPIKKWTQCGLSNKILLLLDKYKYTSPFPVQCQTIPFIMNGNNVICIAITGSGKTLAYILPMIRHVLNNISTHPYGKPISIILSPTRELAQQIYTECCKFTQNLPNINILSIYGGVPITDQINNLRSSRGSDILIATPGRLIDILCTNNGRLLDIKYVSYFVLDEADRLFDLGFESQITSILHNVRPDKQLLMFSATFPKKIEKIAIKYFLYNKEEDGDKQADDKDKDKHKDGDKNKKKKKKKKKKKNNAKQLRDPNLVQITIGNSISSPCQNVAQFVYIVSDESEKFKSLLRLLSEWYGRGNILIFVDTRNNVDLLFNKLFNSGYFSLILHGGIDQLDRDYTIIDYKNRIRTILISTSVASRGLDVSSLRVVINYTPPHHYEDYIHRIGRTGRANNRGVSYTFINRDNLNNELKYIPHIVKAMKKSSNFNNKTSENITKELLDLNTEYYNQVNCGNIKYYRNSGYNSKGYSFDISESSQNKKRQIERQKVVYGDRDELELWNQNKDITIIEKKDNNNKDGDAYDKKQEKDKDIPTDPLKRRLETLQKALQKAKKLKEKNKKKLKKIKKKKKKNKNQKNNKKINLISDEQIRKTIEKTINICNKKYEEQTKKQVESIAKLITAEISGNISNNNNNNNNNDNNNKKETGYHSCQFDINSYPSSIRKIITKKQTLNTLKENYNVRIIQKGTFNNNNNNKNTGLYLQIEGENIKDIKSVIKELKQILTQQTSKYGGAHLKNYNYGKKYTVV